MCNNERLLNMFLSGNLDEKGIGILDTTLKDVIGVKINDPAFTSTSYDGYTFNIGIRFRYLHRYLQNTLNILLEIFKREFCVCEGNTEFKNILCILPQRP